MKKITKKYIKENIYSVEIITNSFCRRFSHSIRIDNKLFRISGIDQYAFIDFDYNYTEPLGICITKKDFIDSIYNYMSSIYLLD